MVAGIIITLFGTYSFNMTTPINIVTDQSHAYLYPSLIRYSSYSSLGELVLSSDRAGGEANPVSSSSQRRHCLNGAMASGFVVVSATVFASDRFASLSKGVETYPGVSCR